MLAAHREHRGARREALIENIDLRARITAELKREQAEQHRFSGTRRSDDHHMPDVADMRGQRSEEHTSELQSLMRISYADFGLKKKNVKHIAHNPKPQHTNPKEETTT